MEFFISQILKRFTQVMNESNKTSLSFSEIKNILMQIDVQMKNQSLTEGQIASNVLEKITGNEEKKKLTAPEVSNFWAQYMGDSMSICVNQYFLNIIQDKELQSIIEFALQLSHNHITQLNEFYNEANFQVPHGFTEQDVNLNAPPLFTDAFIAFYTQIMTIHGITAYALALTTCDREDIRNYFLECIVTASELLNKIVKYRQNKGEIQPSPSIPSPEYIEYVKKTGIISNLVGDKRPLNVSEINNLFFNTKENTLNKALYLAFSQVAKTEDVRDIAQTLVKKSGKHIETFNKMLEEDGFSALNLHDNEVTNSTVSPFSDKLMMFHISFLESAALAFYGAGLSSSLRSDVIMAYDQIFKDIRFGGMKVYDVLVKHEWLEKQPEAIDRKALTQGKTK